MSEPTTGPGFGKRLLLLTALALLVRVAFLLLEPPTRLAGDERTWTDWAIENLVTPKVHFSPFRTHMIFYPPLYPYFIAVPYAFTGGLAAVKWLQVLLGALLVPVIGLLGARVFGERAGLLAAAAVAFYPELVWFTAHFWSETLFLLPLWLGFERVLAADARRSAKLAALAGLLWGVAVLVRETVLYFVPVAGLWLAWRGAGGDREEPLARRLGRAAALVLAAALTVAPWTWRNWVVFRAFVPVSTAGGQNMFQGNCEIPRDETYEMVDAVKGRIEQYRYAMRMGLGCVWERQPTWLFEKLVEQMPNFWEADSLVLIHIKRGAYGEVDPRVAVAAAVVVLLPYLAALLAFLLGLAAAPLRREAVLLLVFLAFYNALHIATHGFARYRLPAMPVLFLIGAAGFAAWRGGDWRPAWGPRTALAAGLCVLLALILVPSVRANAAHPAFGLGARAEEPAQDGGAGAPTGRP